LKRNWKVPEKTQDTVPPVGTKSASAPSGEGLRARRRSRTTETIRKAAIELALSRGLDNITAEMIAERAGISLRTFFNYFGFKEEALIPPPLGFPPEAAEKFAHGKGALIDDLLDMLAESLEHIQAERAHIRAIMQLADEHPRLMTVRERTFRQYEDEFRLLLARRLRLPDDHEKPALMAAVISAAFRVAMRRWVSTEGGDAAYHIGRALKALPGLFSSAEAD